MGGDGRWICVRQHAGPLVKEQRAVRPRLSQYDSPYERAEKNKILRPPRDSGVCRTRMDRLELLLALFGFDGWSYTLTLMMSIFRTVLARCACDGGGCFIS